jgi:Flp pilus assembly protein TadD
LVRLSPFFAVALGFGLMSVWFQKHQNILGEAVQTENFAGRLAGAGMAVWFYLGKALWPVDLCMIYPRWQIDAHSPVAYLPVLLLVVALGVCWWFRQSWGRAFLFGVGCFAVMLFPVLGFFDMYFMVFSRVSDHFAYLPLTAIVALVAAGLRRALPGKIFCAVGFALVAALSVLTVQRAKVFASDEALWRDTVAKNPRAWNAHNNLACNFAERGQLDEAMKEFKLSLQLHPRNASAHRNLGKALAMRGQWVEAEPHFRAALDIKPNDTDALTAYAAALAEHGRPDEAIKLFRAALQIKAEVSTRLQLAPLLAAAGATAEAIAEFRRAVAAQPDSTEAQNNLAWLLATSADANLRNGAEAVRLAEQACRLTGRKDPAMLGTLAAAYAEAGEFTNAVAAAEQAIELAQASGNGRFAQINRQLMQLYRAGRAYHEPARTKTTDH